MTTVADLPASAVFQPQSWTYTLTGEKQEHFLGWAVPFADLQTFWQKVLFTTGVIPVTGGSITRVFPLVCPLNANLVALEIRPGQPPQVNQRGQSHPDGPWEEVLDEEEEPTGVYRPRAAAPPWGLVYPLVRFGVPTYATSGNQAFLEVTKEANTERVTVPGHAYWLETDGGTVVERVAQDVGLARGTCAFRVTWHEVPNIPAADAVFHTILDRVNDATVTVPILGSVCPAGTLKAASQTASASITYGNNKKGSISLQLTYMPGGWNRAVASAVGYEGQLLKINSDAGPPFPSANFGPIFNPTV